MMERNTVRVMTPSDVKEYFVASKKRTIFKRLSPPVLSSRKFCKKPLDDLGKAAQKIRKMFGKLPFPARRSQSIDLYGKRIIESYGIRNTKDIFQKKPTYT